MNPLFSSSNSDYTTFFSVSDRLLRMDLLRQFAVHCSGFSGKTTLKGASLGYDYNSGNAHSELYNYHRSSLTFYGDSRVPSYYHPKTFTDFIAQNYDLTLVAGSSLEEEQEIWQAYKDKRNAEVSQSVIHSGALRLGLQNHIFQQVLFATQPETWFTCLSTAKLITLSLLISQCPATGTVLECGTFQGGSAIFLGHHLRLLGRNAVLHAFDTFQGIPAALAEDENTPWTTGQFTDTSVERVGGFIEKNGLKSQVTLHPGLINENVPTFVESADEISFAFLDTDQYISTKTCLEVIVPQLKTNGLIVIDDAVDTGVALAIREIHQDNPALRGFYPINNMYVLFNKSDSRLNTFAACE